MSEDKHDTERSFLSRWSQRKREATLPDAEDGAAAQSDRETEISPAMAGDDVEDEFDLSSLPKLEDITETTDITGFLRKGVPEGMKNAVLRKSWALDPAIRNYVNPALDYAYDWNTPGGVPGNSELAVGTDIAKMVLQIMGNGSPDEAVAPDEQAIAPLHHSDAPGSATDSPEIAALQHSRLEFADEPVRLSEPAGLPLQISDDSASPIIVVNDSTEQSFALESSATQQPARRHGSAKPKI